MNRTRTRIALLAVAVISASTHATEPTGRRWMDMHYGPYFTASVEVPGQGERNIAYKGLLLRVGGRVTHAAGSADDATLLFDTDLLRYTAGWTNGLLNMRNIAWDGSHGTHPSLKGDVVFTSPASPGWARPGTGSLEDPRKLPYGPLPRDWAHWKGLYLHEDQVVLSYTVGGAKVLELPAFERSAAGNAFLRHLQIDGANEPLVIRISGKGDQGLELLSRAGGDTDSKLASDAVVLLGRRPAPKSAANDKPAFDEPKDVVRNLLAKWSFDRETGKNATGSGGEKGVAAKILGAKWSEGHKSGGLSFRGKSRVEITEPGLIDLGKSDFSVASWIKTSHGGTILAKTGPEWEEQGKTLFVRDGRLCYDVGWVGLVTSKDTVADNRWHHVAMTFRSAKKHVDLFVDGKPSGSGSLDGIQADVKGHTLRMGFTASDFPQPSQLDGTLDDLRLYRTTLTRAEVAQLAGGKADASAAEATLISVNAAPKGATWKIDEKGVLLALPASPATMRFSVAFTRTGTDKLPQALSLPALTKIPPQNLTPLTKGGPKRWEKSLVTAGKVGGNNKAFAVDELTAPYENPWNSWMRLGGFDFFEGGTRAAVCTWMGDVWIVDGIDDDLDKLTWTRVASGMFQSLGLKIVDGDIYVLNRDQITVLRDLNGDGETDFYENFNNDMQVTEHFHEFAMDLQTDAAGNFYYMKGGRHAKDAVVPQHGTLIKVSRSGSTAEILAKGFRAPNGLCVNSDGSFITSDQEGHWTPSNRINWVKKGGFYGYNWSYFEDGKKRTDFDKPICWLHKQYDRSPAAQLWADTKKWGPLNGSLLSLSYGTGHVSNVLYEDVDGQKQGGAMKLDIPMFPTGVMRGRFRKEDGQLYLCGLFGWSSNRTRAGGLYRVRYTGKPLNTPVALHATKRGMVIAFSDPLDAERSGVASRYSIARWNHRWRQNYGSKDYKLSDGKVGRDKVAVKSVKLSKDGKSVLLEIDDMKPCMQMHIRYRLQAADGSRVSHEIYNTIHALGSFAPFAGRFE